MKKRNTGGKEFKLSCPEKLLFFFDNSRHCRYRVAYGGRSSGKSWAAAQGLILRALQGKIRILCCREIQNSIKESVKKTIENNIERMGLSPYFTFKQDSIVCYNGSEFLFKGLYANVEQIKSLENIAIAYVEEAETVSEKSWQVLIPTIRAPKSEIWVCFNPRDYEDATYQRFVVNPPDNCVSALINYSDNPFCPSVMIEEAENLKRINLGLYRHIWLGECRQANENALWKAETMIEPFRHLSGIDPSELDRIVIGIDPAVTSGEKADETGIVAVGLKRGEKGSDHHYYVLEDGSLRGSPSKWAEAAIEFYYFYSADRIIAEVNNGGELVEAVIRNIDPSVSFRAVRASRGKILRAEPIAALYEKGLVHHAGYFTRLEDQMCNYTGDATEKSPDRLDALVWALTELSEAKDRRAGSAKFDVY
jgi:predicted phage terminase large subunit-like protein